MVALKVHKLFYFVPVFDEKMKKRPSHLLESLLPDGGSSPISKTSGTN